MRESALALLLTLVLIETELCTTKEINQSSSRQLTRTKQGFWARYARSCSVCHSLTRGCHVRKMKRPKSRTYSAGIFRQECSQ